MNLGFGKNLPHSAVNLIEKLVLWRKIFIIKDVYMIIITLSWEKSIGQFLGSFLVIDVEGPGFIWASTTRLPRMIFRSTVLEYWDEEFWFSLLGCFSIRPNSSAKELKYSARLRFLLRVGMIDSLNGPL